MTRAREQQINLSDTPYYHCVNRCVRRSFLCGTDSVTGKCYEYRKQWIVDRIKQLSAVFSMDVCAYAVMDNHYHVVLRVDADRLESWSDDEVMQRWRLLFNGNFLVQRYLKGDALGDAELKVVADTAALWRERLKDISWFMRCLNENIARRANIEDEVKGHFWEGRFKSQALLDEQALLSCMMYVDLNPIRAGMAKTPEQSEHTSIYERIRAMSRSKPRGRPRKVVHRSKSLEEVSPASLSAFADEAKAGDQCKAIPFNREDYIALLDWTGRAIRGDKRGAIANSLMPIFVRLGLHDEYEWLDNMLRFKQRYANNIGSIERLRGAAVQQGLHWLKGCGQGSAMTSTLSNSYSTSHASEWIIL